MQNFTAAEGVLQNDLTNGGGALHAQALTQPTKGLIDFNVDGSFTFYTNGQFNDLAAGQSETVSFSYVAFNATTQQTGSTQVNVVVSNPAVVVIPNANDDAESTNEDIPLAITNLLSNDSDPAGGTLSDIRIVTLPTGGVLTLNGANVAANDIVSAGDLSAGHLFFVPNLNFNGVSSFQYQVNNGQAYSNPANVVVTVNPINDAPVAHPDSNGVVAGGTIASVPANTLLANDTDVDIGDTLTLTAIGYNGDFLTGSDIPHFALFGQYGELTTQSDSSYSYVASLPASRALAAGQTAHDVFDYTVTDSGGLTSSSTLDILIVGVNDAPTASDDTANVNDKTTNPIDVLGNDADPDTGDHLHVNGFRAGSTGSFLTTYVDAYGTLTVDAGGGVSFLANGSASTALAAGATATDVVSYQISDDAGLTANAALTIHITGVNDAPVAVDDVASVNENAIASGNLLTNDHDPDQGDSMSIVGARVSGGGSFVADVTDTYGSLHVNPDGSYSFTANGAASIALAAGVTHTDSFEYQVRDVAGLTSNAHITVTITGVNDAPAAVNDSLAVTEGLANSGNLLTNDSDVDAGDSIRVTGIRSSNGTSVSFPGSASLADNFGTLHANSDGSYSFTADGVASNALGAGQTIVDTFGYTINDGSNAASTANINITITGVNDAPTAFNDTVNLSENSTTTLALLANDTDPDTGDHLHVTGFRKSSTDPFVSSLTDAYGTLTLAANGTVNFQANGAASAALAVGATATDTFSYQIRDDAGLTASAGLTLNITGVNNAPIARNDAYSYNNTAGSVFTVNAANGVLHHLDAGETVDDSDVDSTDILTVVGAGTTLTTTSGQHVTLAADGSFVYDAVDGFYGHDSFMYTISDGHGGNSSAIVNLNVAAPPKLADKFLINEIAVNTGPATFTITTDNGVDPNTVTTGVAHIEIIKNINTATSSADLRSMQVEIVNPHGDLSIISMSQLVGLTVDKTGTALNLSSAIAAGGSLELFEPNSSGLGIWAVYDSKGTLKSSGTYHDNAWHLGADVTTPIAVNLAQAGASLDLFIANGAAISDLHGIDTTQSWLSGVGALGNAPHALGSVSPFALPEKQFAWYGGAQLSPSSVPADVAALLAANQQFNASQASSSDTVFARVYDHYLSSASGTGTDKVFIDSNDAGDWTYGPKAILTDGYENTVGKSDPVFVANPLDSNDNMNPMQGSGQHGDVLASITNEDGQTIAVFSGTGLGGNGPDFLYGVNSDDLLYGGAGDDFIYGSGGNDLLFGGSGGDHLMGGAGNDALSGDSGNDWLEGGIGNDILYGGSGKDILSGGAGSDSFLYLAVTESAPSAPDVISDFVHGSDKIDLSAIDAKTSVPGNQAFAFGGHTSAVQANAVTWFESGGNTIVQIDNTGNTVADMQVVLTGIGLGLTATDFVL